MGIKRMQLGWFLGLLVVPGLSMAKPVEVALPFDKLQAVAVASARSVCSLAAQSTTREVLFDGARLPADTQRYITKRLQRGTSMRLVVELSRFTVQRGRAEAQAKAVVRLPAWLADPKAAEGEQLEYIMGAAERAGAVTDRVVVPLDGVRSADEITVQGRLLARGTCFDDRAKDQAWATVRVKVKLVLEE